MEIRFRLLVVPTMRQEHKAIELEYKRQIGQTGILKFGERGNGTWFGSQFTFVGDGDEKRPIFEGDEKKYSFVGQATSATVKWLQSAVGNEFAFRYEYDDKGIYACEVTRQHLTEGYVFRTESARSVARDASDLWNVYIGMYSENANEYKAIHGKSVRKTWWFQAKLDKGILDKDAGKLEYRLLRAGLEKFDNFTGEIGTERFLQGSWEENAHIYRVDKTEVNVPFLAKTNRGHMILFSDVGKSGLPEAHINQDMTRSETKSRYPLLPLYALWAPRQTPTGFTPP
jgi:hypothetical protein